MKKQHANLLIVLIAILIMVFIVKCVNNTEKESTTFVSTPVKEKVNIIKDIKTSDYELEFSSNVKKTDFVYFNIKTNLPLPIKVCIDISLKNQGEDELYIGKSEFITLTDTVTKYILDCSDKKLGSGEYYTNVSIYKWAYKENKKYNLIETKEYTNSLILNNSNISNKSKISKSKKEKFIFGLPSGSKWEMTKYTKNLGKYKKFKIVNRNHLMEAYYFKDVDYTLFKNTHYNTIVTYRHGEINSL